MEPKVPAWSWLVRSIFLKTVNPYLRSPSDSHPGRYTCSAPRPSIAAVPRNPRPPKPQFVGTRPIEDALSDAPFLLVLAGPNGSGKSTLTDYLIEAGIDFGEYINPDRIAARLDLPEPTRSKQAQAIADFQRDRCRACQLSFSFETVMSHPSKVDFMIR